MADVAPSLEPVEEAELGGAAWMPHSRLWWSIGELANHR